LSKAVEDMAIDVQEAKRRIGSFYFRAGASSSNYQSVRCEFFVCK